MSNDTREALAAVRRHASEMNRYFTSGNCVPIERAVIPATEWHALHAAIDELAALTEQPAAPQAEPVAYIEHHKGGDNLVWEAQKSSPRCTPLYTHPAAAPQALTDEQRLHLSQAADLLDEYGNECSRGGADSTAKGCEASAYVLRQILRAAPAAPQAEEEERHCMNCAEFGECRPNNLHGCGYEPPAAPAQEPQQPAPTVQVLGVKADGSEHDLGAIPEVFAPKFKMREIVRSYFGHFDEGDDSQADMCMIALEEFQRWYKAGLDAVAKQPAASSPAPAVQPTEAVAELVEALARVLRDFPTDADMWQAGWSGEDVARACDAYDHAKAVHAKHRQPQGAGQPQGGSNG